MINEASLEAGGPDNIAVTVEVPTMETSSIMIRRQFILNFPACKVAANPPALVDETADVRKAARDIVNGCTFDNNLPCIAEKEIVALDGIADELMNSRSWNGYARNDGCRAQAIRRSPRLPQSSLPAPRRESPEPAKD